MSRLHRILVIASLFGAFLLSPAYAQKTKAQLTTEVSTTFPDNSSGLITPLGVRTFQNDLLNSIMPTAPVVSGNLACFNGTTGLLRDCGAAPNALVVGTTSIASGSTTSILYDNSGVLGEYTVTGTGSVAMSTNASMTTPTISSPVITGHPTIEGVTSTGATGAGAFVFGTTPTISSPVLTGSPSGSGASTTVNGVTCTLGSTCTISASAGTITPGTTAITSGIDKGLLYDNAGVLGNLATANSGVLVTSGAGVPSISTTLPSGLSIASPTLTGTVGGSGVIPSAVLANTAVGAGSYGTSTSIPSFTVNAAGQLTAASGNVVIAPAGTLTGTTLASNVVTSSLTTLGVVGSGTWQGTAVGLTYGGTNNALVASNGGIVYSDASKLNILSGTATPGQCLLSGASTVPTWGSCAGGATVTSIAGNTGAFTLAGGITNATNQIQQDGNYAGWGTQNCTLAASVSVNVLTVSLKDNAGNNPSATSPCNINYRSSTSSTGATTLVAQTSALSIDTNAIGATLGSHSSNTPFRFWVVAFNNSGTNVLGLINCTDTNNIYPLNEDAPQSSTAMSASATSAGVFYTQNGTTVASKSIRILGYVEYGSGLTTAGTYASGPTLIQSFGPGQRKPGETVQRVLQSSTTATTSSTPSFIATSVSQNFTKTSSANSVRLDSSGTVQSGAVGSEARIRFYRGNAACTTAIGVIIGTDPPSTNGINSTLLTWFDTPAASGTTSAQYTVCLSAAASLTVSWPYLTGGMLILEEIMG